MMNQTSEALFRQLNIEPGSLRIDRIEMPATLMLAQFPVATMGEDHPPLAVGSPSPRGRCRLWLSVSETAPEDVR
jgi:hypothetical protein